MTTEDEFQALLDANPEDHQTRLVFADWLEERGDPRAEGYRALGMNRMFPVRDERRWHWWNVTEEMLRVPSAADNPHAGLPSDWFEACDRTNALNPERWRGYTRTRREAEDIAARAFAKLPAVRRAELLAGKGAEELTAKRKKKPKAEPKKQPKVKVKKKAQPKKPTKRKGKT